jgi:hypothetical protein
MRCYLLDTTVFSRLLESDMSARPTPRVGMKSLVGDMDIADTAVKQNLVLVTDECNLAKVTRAAGGQAIALADFLAGG